MVLDLKPEINIWAFTFIGIDKKVIDIVLLWSIKKIVYEDSTRTV